MLVAVRQTLKSEEGTVVLFVQALFGLYWYVPFPLQTKRCLYSVSSPFQGGGVHGTAKLTSLVHEDAALF
jgi:hypothetical protein